ncbi:MAG TPA: EF-hand domain-containing protein [Steroidobacteraceae bacterium]|jgi:Ca2+-binding EF-hand superfamily protein|nr:EF-hand domain-containing protein [Steroidobacteraceae bacterium]
MKEKIIKEKRDAAEIERLREDFEYFDRNDDGLMEFEEFQRFLQALDAGMSDEEARLGFSEIDTDRDGVIEFEEFLDWWGSP